MLNELVNKLKQRTRLQPTPIPYSDGDYSELIIDGLKTLYIDLCREDRYTAEYDELNKSILTSLTLSEQEYILNAAHIGFYQMVQGTVNAIVGYSTDALTITNADKPYANISNEILKLKDRQIELFSKLRANETKKRWR